MAPQSSRPCIDNTETISLLANPHYGIPRAGAAPDGETVSFMKGKTVLDTGLDLQILVHLLYPSGDYQIAHRVLSIDTVLGAVARSASCP